MSERNSIIAYCKGVLADYLIKDQIYVALLIFQGVFFVNMYKILQIIALAAFLNSGLASADEAPEFVDLADQLSYLAVTYKVDMQGLELTQFLPSRRVSGEVEKQLKELLSGFNYVSVKKPGSNIEKIIIIGRKQDLPERTILKTLKKGNSHLIRAAITGPGGIRIEVPLIVDTGAEHVVLPKSMLSKLGMENEPLLTRRLQTANGLTSALVARLSMLEIGNEVIRDVEAAFIDDKLLGGTKLLGMNVLKEFRVTLDDQKQTITLIKAK